MNLLNINPTPPTGAEIITLIFLAVVAIALFQFAVYTKVKRVKTKYGYRITCRQILRLQMVALKSAIADTSRLILLWVVMTLPLIGIAVSTELSALFVLGLILTKVRGGLLLVIGIAFTFLFLFATIVLIHYFFGKYGSVYKLPFVFLVRNDIKQFLKKHQDIHMALITGSTTYIVVIINLLIMLVNAPSVLSKIVVGIIIAILLIEVLPNKKYENAMNLCKKFEGK